MDIYCPRCGEPYELDYIQHEITPEERKDFWAGKGCQSCKGKEIKKTPLRAQISGVFREVLGSDVDGIAAEMEDAELLLGRRFWE